MNNEKMLKLWFFFLSKSKRVNGCICIKYRGQRYDKIVHAIAVRIRLLVLFRIMNLFWCYDVNAFPMLLWKKGGKIMKIWKFQVRLNERTNIMIEIVWELFNKVWCILQLFFVHSTLWCTCLMISGE